MIVLKNDLKIVRKVAANDTLSFSNFETFPLKSPRRGWGKDFCRLSLNIVWALEAREILNF